MNTVMTKDEPTLTVESDGTKKWRLNGKLHREDGPAIEHTDGAKEWFVNGTRHREDGPAIERNDGSKDWFVTVSYTHLTLPTNREV